MKANKEQYEKAIPLYESGGKTAVLDFALQEGIDDWGSCPQCEESTPMCADNSCLVCGSTIKEP
jgi:hypothetical protein